MHVFRLCTVLCILYYMLSAPHIVAQAPQSFFASLDLGHDAAVYAYERFLVTNPEADDYPISRIDAVQFIRRSPFNADSRTIGDPTDATTWYSGASAALEVGIYGNVIAKWSPEPPLWISPTWFGLTRVQAYVRSEGAPTVPSITFESVGEGGRTQTAMTDFYYEYDFSDLTRIGISPRGEQEYVAFWTPPPGAGQRLHKIKEWLRKNYDTTKVSAPCLTCPDVSFGNTGPISLAIAGDAFGPGGNVSVTETSVVYHSEGSGEVTSKYDYRYFEKIRVSQLRVGKERSESMIRKIIAKLTELSGKLDLDILVAWEAEQKPRHDCGTYYCMTSLQVIVPREVVLGVSEELKWATFDITLLFTIVDLNSISRAELIVDAYADVKRSGKILPPLAENIFRCPPLAKDKRNDEQNIADTIVGWIRE